MKKLEHDAFLEALTELFRMQRKHGTVVLTMKRYDGQTKPVPKNKNTPAPTPSEYLCLIRAHVTGQGNTKHKISTVVFEGMGTLSDFLPKNHKFTTCNSFCQFRGYVIREETQTEKEDFEIVSRDARELSELEGRYKRENTYLNTIPRVHQKDAVKFQMAYCSLLKTNTDGLKKSKKVKKTKA